MFVLKKQDGRCGRVQERGGDAAAATGRFNGGQRPVTDPAGGDGRLPRGGVVYEPDIVDESKQLVSAQAPGSTTLHFTEPRTVAIPIAVAHERHRRQRHLQQHRRRPG